MAIRRSFFARLSKALLVAECEAFGAGERLCDAVARATLAMIAALSGAELEIGGRLHRALVDSEIHVLQAVGRPMPCAHIFGIATANLQRVTIVGGEAAF